MRLTFLIVLLAGNGVIAQQWPNWQNLDLGTDAVFGISTDKAYSQLFKGIWKYNVPPDVSVQTRYHPAERDYADPGEAGLLVCTWPHSAHPGDHGVRYRDEVRTGIEYQVATGMIEKDMLPPALSILKGLDDRYQPQKHNPWNEIECGDHYARAMASWGCSWR